MKKTVLFSLLTLSTLFIFAQKEKNVSIIPEPVSIVRSPGNYSLPAQVTVSIPNIPELKQTTESILGKLAATGKKVSLVKTGKASIRFVLNKTADKELGDEGYHLSVKTTGIVISANKPAGLFYGAQTLWQLLPQEIESISKISGVNWRAPAVEITDYPRLHGGA